MADIQSVVLRSVTAAQNVIGVQINNATPGVDELVKSLNELVETIKNQNVERMENIERREKAAYGRLEALQKKLLEFKNNATRATRSQTPHSHTSIFTCM